MYMFIPEIFGEQMATRISPKKNNILDENF